jgi:hypothetical protein
MNRSALRIAIIIFTLTTAGVHLALGIGSLASGNPDSLSIPFILNGLAFLVLLAGLYIPNFPFLADNYKLTHYLMIALAAVTLVLYFVMNGFGEMGPAAIIAKLAEALLIIATFLHLRAEHTVSV